jgi:hypothetical protein
MVQQVHLEHRVHPEQGVQVVHLVQGVQVDHLVRQEVQELLERVVALEKLVHQEVVEARVKRGHQDHLDHLDRQVRLEQVGRQAQVARQAVQELGGLLALLV